MSYTGCGCVSPDYSTVLYTDAEWSCISADLTAMRMLPCYFAAFMCYALVSSELRYGKLCST